MFTECWVKDLEILPSEPELVKDLKRELNRMRRHLKHRDDEIEMVIDCNRSQAEHIKELQARLTK